jgi:hypothetical protein
MNGMCGIDDYYALSGLDDIGRFILIGRCFILVDVHRAVPYVNMLRPFRAG